jgi:hypothetical protein
MRLPCLAFALVFALAPAVLAQESEDDRRAAATFFLEGQKAYNAGDFRHAAESFEGAYKRAPRLPPLWNAARAWDKGGELVRAANLYASYLRKAPPSAPDRNSATRALRELEAKLAKLEVHASSVSDLKVDGVAIDLDDQSAGSLVLYVTPGAHVIEGQHDGALVQEKANGTPGASMSVVLLARPDAQPPPPPPPPPPQEKPHSGFSPIVVAVGGGLTVIAGGLLIWSGIDTVSQRTTFNANPTQQNLATGQSDEVRTNVLVGVTAGLGLLTAVAAIFVDWKGHTREHASSRLRLHVAPGGGMLGGTF